jgi:hypothetical protein
MKKHRPRSWCGEETKTEMNLTVVETPSYEREAGMDRTNAYLHGSRGVNREGEGFGAKKSRNIL